MMDPPLAFERCYPDLGALRLHFDVMDSTQLYCKRNMARLLQNGILQDEENMVVVTCNEQTNGIGTRDTKKKQDRVWISEKGNIFTTFVLLWKREDIEKVKYLAQTSTVAVSKTLEYFHLVTKIKWINDVLVNEKKIAGCLVNLYYLDDFPALLNRYVCVMIGIGINITLTDKNNFLHNNYTSLHKELQRDFNTSHLTPSVEDVTEKLIYNLNAVLIKLRKEGFSSFLDYITPRLLYKDRNVLVDTDNELIDGYLQGMLHDGSLLLLRGKNELVRVNTGHLRLFDGSSG
ncbi:Biotin--acetyl-CoA-carboxylase ligase, putative [Plasmodium knowlesi strain H]|uniref:Biotin--acetyl-CoA-carboxylase ligase, putative n=3 Tax=Plasmodium knowlesi TaxID=5850 RepID=A0A5K1UAH6_PLAKH|nr:biotin--protein ligase 1, putative [Plasmodium knowlesi strain H]OTN68403.1 putative Biotin--acetyl-CoA-carboxylase ligase [Plasmodium knowlesi]CAA9987163.1 biotin--protein ligase 1, putative [Plasmodium knowlesi strain H]SBO23920.1 Biotin--acetyl-CoA-carboxylase ligase, putative [Plasmodium knowlesi strain H]SBO25817.1 Biotin--acetyl-CoA-carboxylase ligase, putative [Plasmodium knowlesi strain H]VVS76637.1 biotin--protein ligase 1, putative [Plasmodium knowlesi strain H]|eukprot:XP_002261787.1 Biotin--acetyl-CoA-carboxylase ligase, putative [Plasmodium knowlesi strain H]